MAIKVREAVKCSICIYFKRGWILSQEKNSVLLWKIYTKNDMETPEKLFCDRDFCDILCCRTKKKIF